MWFDGINAAIKNPRYTCQTYRRDNDAYDHSNQKFFHSLLSSDETHHIGDK